MLYGENKTIVLLAMHLMLIILLIWHLEPRGIEYILIPSSLSPKHYYVNYIYYVSYYIIHWTIQSYIINLKVNNYNVNVNLYVTTTSFLIVIK